MRSIKPLLCLLLVLLLGTLTGCGAPSDPDTAQESIQVIAMDTAMLITTYGENSVTAAYAAEDCIRDLEAKLSRTLEDSDIARLNAAGGKTVAVSQDTYTLLNQAALWCQRTGGAFDPTVAPLVAAWGFAGGGEFRVPAQGEIDALLPLVDCAAVTADARPPEGEDAPEEDPFAEAEEPLCSAALGPGQAIDLGGIAKGYASDKLVGLFRENAIPRANVSLGGSVLAWGDRPDGNPWRVGVQDPGRVGDPNGFAGVLELTDSFAVTSGGYQRFFEQDGKTYHHIIDPATGRPAESGLTSVTVVAGLEGDFPGTMCDALSTALFVMGEDGALDFRRTWDGPPFELVLVTEDGRVVVTGDLAFTLDGESGYVLENVA